MVVQGDGIEIVEGSIVSEDRMGFRTSRSVFEHRQTAVSWVSGGAPGVVRPVQKCSLTKAYRMIDWTDDR